MAKRFGGVNNIKEFQFFWDSFFDCFFYKNAYVYVCLSIYIKNDWKQ